MKRLLSIASILLLLTPAPSLAGWSGWGTTPGSGGGGVSSHDDLTDVTPNQHHTPTVDTNTNAATECVGTNVYLDGEGNCTEVDLSTHEADPNIHHTPTVDTDTYVTGKDAHDHVGGDGAQIDHTGLANKGTLTHTEVETELTNLDNAITAVSSGYSRRQAVANIVDNTAAPPTEVSGDRYILDNTGASHADWDGAAANSIVEFNGTSWVATAPLDGYVSYVSTQAKDALYVEGNGAWELRDVAVVDHADLSNVTTSQHHVKTGVDATPADGDDTDAISSNWAFDHDADANAHHTPTVDTDTYVTNKDLHDHLGGDGAQILHSSLGSVGSNDHHVPTVDTFVTNKDSHDHLGGDGAQILHSSLGSVGANDHHTPTVDTDTFVTNKDAHDHLGGDGAQILHSSLGSVGANDHHTPTVDTSAATLCTGANVVLDGEGNCIDMTTGVSGDPSTDEWVDTGIGSSDPGGWTPTGNDPNPLVGYTGGNATGNDPAVQAHALSNSYVLYTWEDSTNSVGYFSIYNGDTQVKAPTTLPNSSGYCLDVVPNPSDGSAAVTWSGDAGGQAWFGILSATGTWSVGPVDWSLGGAGNGSCTISRLTDGRFFVAGPTGFALINSSGTVEVGPITWEGIGVVDAGNQLYFLPTAFDSAPVLDGGVIMVYRRDLNYNGNLYVVLNNLGNIAVGPSLISTGTMNNNGSAPYDSGLSYLRVAGGGATNSYITIVGKSSGTFTTPNAAWYTVLDRSNSYNPVCSGTFVDGALAEGISTGVWAYQLPDGFYDNANDVMILSEYDNETTTDTEIGAWIVDPGSCTLASPPTDNPKVVWTSTSGVAWDFGSGDISTENGPYSFFAVETSDGGVTNTGSTNPTYPSGSSPTIPVIWSPADTRIGVGINNPTVELDVDGTINASTDITVNGTSVSTGAHTVDTFVTNLDAHDHLGGDGAQILHSSLGSIGANDHHTPTVDTNTNAATECTGTTTYLDGEGGCDDISTVYEAAGAVSTHAGISDAHHTPTVDTNANTLCTGDTTYLDGEGNCDDISTAYEAAGAVTTHAAISDAHHTPTVDTNTNAETICTGTDYYLDGEGNCDQLSSGSTTHSGLTNDEPELHRTGLDTDDTLRDTIITGYADGDPNDSGFQIAMNPTISAPYAGQCLIADRTKVVTIGYNNGGNTYIHLAADLPTAGTALGVTGYTCAPLDSSRWILLGFSGDLGGGTYRPQFRVYDNNGTPLTAWTDASGEGLTTTQTAGSWVFNPFNYEGDVAISPDFFAFALGNFGYQNSQKYFTYFKKSDYSYYGTSTGNSCTGVLYTQHTTIVARPDSNVFAENCATVDTKQWRTLVRQANPANDMTNDVTTNVLVADTQANAYTFQDFIKIQGDNSSFGLRYSNGTSNTYAAYSLTPTNFQYITDSWAGLNTTYNGNMVALDNGNVALVYGMTTTAILQMKQWDGLTANNTFIGTNPYQFFGGGASNADNKMSMSHYQPGGGVGGMIGVMDPYGAPTYNMAFFTTGAMGSAIEEDILYTLVPRVGMGTATPGDYQLHVVGDAEVTGTFTVNGQAPSTGSHTVDTNAATECTGTTTYLDGEGTCDDLSTVYEANGAVSTHAAISDAHHTPTVDTNTNAETICAGVNVVLDGEGNCVDMSVGASGDSTNDLIKNTDVAVTPPMQLIDQYSGGLSYPNPNGLAISQSGDIYMGWNSATNNNLLNTIVERDGTVIAGATTLLATVNTSDVKATALVGTDKIAVVYGMNVGSDAWLYFGIYDGTSNSWTTAPAQFYQGASQSIANLGIAALPNGNFMMGWKGGYAVYDSTGTEVKAPTALPWPGTSTSTTYIALSNDEILMPFYYANTDIRRWAYNISTDSVSIASSILYTWAYPVYTEAKFVLVGGNIYFAQPNAYTNACGIRGFNYSTGGQSGVFQVGQSNPTYNSNGTCDIAPSISGTSLLATALGTTDTNTLYFYELDTAGTVLAESAGQNHTSPNYQYDLMSGGVADTSETIAFVRHNGTSSNQIIWIQGGPSDATYETVAYTDAGETLGVGTSTPNTDVILDVVGDANITGTFDADTDFTVAGASVALDSDLTTHAGVSDAHHTQTVDTSAATECTGTTTYLDGEGGCDDISTVYEAAGAVSTHAGISDAHHTATVDTNAQTICDTGEFLDGDGNCVSIGVGAADTTNDLIKNADVPVGVVYEGQYVNTLTSLSGGGEGRSALSDSGHWYAAYKDAASTNLKQSWIDETGTIQANGSGWLTTGATADTRVKALPGLDKIAVADYTLSGGNITVNFSIFDFNGTPAWDCLRQVVVASSAGNLNGIGLAIMPNDDVFVAWGTGYAIYSGTDESCGTVKAPTAWSFPGSGPYTEYSATSATEIWGVWNSGSSTIRRFKYNISTDTYTVPDAQVFGANIGKRIEIIGDTAYLEYGQSSQCGVQPIDLAAGAGGTWFAYGDGDGVNYAGGLCDFVVNPDGGTTFTGIAACDTSTQERCLYEFGLDGTQYSKSSNVTTVSRTYSGAGFTLQSGGTDPNGFVSLWRHFGTAQDFSVFKRTSPGSQATETVAYTAAGETLGVGTATPSVDVILDVVGDMNVTGTIDADTDLTVAGSSVALDSDLTTHTAISDAHHTKTAVDDTPADGDTTDAISSNWAFDHDADASAHHTATVDTNANTVCTGDTTYLDGEGNCDDISSVYAPAAPVSRLSAISTKTGDYTMTTTDFIVLIDATSNSVTITLPAVSGNSGLRYKFKRLDNQDPTYTVTIDANSTETIDGAETKTITNQYDAMEIVCDGSAWYIM